MSELLLGWLNDEVQLSRRISNFEEDFNNGFLLGELLFKYHQQLNFNEFIDKDDKATRVKNFTLLFDTFKTLGVSIDANIALGIMEKKTGLAKKTICELKMQLEKTTSNAFSKLSKPNKPLSPLKKVSIPKEKFDKITKQHFNNQLNEIHKAQKNINIEFHLSKFSDFQHKQMDKAEVDEKKESQAKLLLQKKFREKQLDNTKKSSDFRNDWEQSNLEKWATNIAVRKLQQDKDNMFKTKLETTKFQNRTISESNAMKVLDQDLKEFEKRTLKRKDDSDESEEEKSIIQSGGLIKKSSTRQALQNSTKTLESKLFKTGLGYEEPRKKVTPEEVEICRHEREKRRRKMIVEQSKKQQIIKIERMDRYIMSTLEQNSKQEKEIEYEIWRAWQNKQVIIQNKNSENEKIKEKEELKAMNLKFKNDELLKTFREEHQKELKDGIDRQQKLKIQDSVKKRKDIYEECKGIIQQFIEMTEVMFEYGQDKNQNEPDPTFVTHLLDEFVENLHESKEIAELELSNYIHARGEWKIEIKRDNEEQPLDPTLENALPVSVINNYYLGNILKTVFTDLYEGKQEKQIEGVENEYLVSLLGLEFSGKKVIGEKVKEKFGFNVIIIEDLICEKMKDFEELKSKGLEVDGETGELMEICLSGKAIPDSMIINLIKQKVENNNKSIIINYPTTYHQCIEFTKAFANISPKDHTPKSNLQTKIESFSRLVWPTETKIFARSLRPCGIDFAIWLDISPEVSLDRFLGRRWREDGNCIHINDENIGDANNLTGSCEGSGLILKNDFKIKNKSKIEQWLDQFGLELHLDNEQYTQKCWHQISAEPSIEDVTNKVFAIIEKGMEMKNKKNEQVERQLQEKIEQNKKVEEVKLFEEELKLKCTFSSEEKIKSSFTSALKSVKMENSFLVRIEKLWSEVEKLTIHGLTNVFQSLRDQEEQKNKYISSTKRNFIRMLTREDQRFFLVKQFQNEYNTFFDSNNDMMVHDYTKEELHQRVEDLETDLLTLIEEKKEDATSERESIMKSGWLESQFDQMICSAHILLQTELNRSFCCQQIISDFYYKKYLVNTGEIQETCLELNVDSELEVIKEDKFPRLDKLLSEVLRLFNKEEEIVDDKNKKGGKAPPKKDDKKQPTKKGPKEEPEEKVELTKEDVEFKKAINTEKSIFRYRVKIIYQYICNKLKRLEEEGIKLYEALEDYLKYTDEVENKAVIEMTKIFKKQIEEETKIEYEVQIHYTQIIETEKILNFKRPKPVILPIAEKIENNRFMTSSIKNMVKSLVNGVENVHNGNK